MTAFHLTRSASHLRPPWAAVPEACARVARDLVPVGALASAGLWLAPTWAQVATPSSPAAAAPVAAPVDAGAPTEPALRKITIKGRNEPEPGKHSLQAVTSTIGKGRQELRDIPQSVTVVTEKLIDDRNLDTVKDVLKNTAGVSFLAAEGGEEDVRLRGFSLQATGDVFVDGLRDPAFYDRDTFFLDRVEVMRGSASMLFGRGSTGGAVNQVTKVPRLIDEHQVDFSMGNHNHARIVGDFNLRTGDNAALRLGVMHTSADNNGAGTSIDKQGLAGTYRWGIGERDEFSLGVYLLDNRNGIAYGMSWIRPTTSSAVSDTTLLPLDPATSYAMASDRNDGRAVMTTLSHTRRIDGNQAITTKLRAGQYGRDLRGSTIRLAAATAQPSGQAVSLATFGDSTVLTRGTQLKIQGLNQVLAQSDYSGKFKLGDTRHEVLAGVDLNFDEKWVYGALTTAQGGVTLNKSNTTVGTPSDGASVAEDMRLLRVTSKYKSKGAGAYVQDLVEVVPGVKLLGGLRYDDLVGYYDTYSIPTNAVSPVTTTRYGMKVSELSKRLGAIWQPSPTLSFHVSAANSFNTSGDAYSLGAANATTPPEESINVEAGGRIDSSDGRFSARFAVFRSTKLHERNTDPDVALITLSGKRHVAGVELDLAGRLTTEWEVFGSYMWMPVAKVDIAVSCTTNCVQTEQQGSRPALTPRHTGTLWTTYKVSPKWRLGGGLTARSSQSPNRNPGWVAPAFVIGDVMAEYEFSEQIKVKTNVSNVTNKLYADQLYTGHYVPGAGRLIQTTLSVKF